MLMIDRPQGFDADWIHRELREERRMDWEPRFWAKVDRQPGCWPWTAHATRGYGDLSVPLTGGGHAYRKAHRVAYELTFGPIPEGMQAHHTCHNKLCVNPAHIELMTAEEHGRLHCREGEERRSYEPCPRGHPYSEENFRRTPNGRVCRLCQREANRKAYAREHPDVRPGRPGRRKKAA